jgi:hypothetical protein
MDKQRMIKGVEISFAEQRMFPARKKERDSCQDHAGMTEGEEQD